MTSRGCPFDCSFCCVTGMFGRKYRYRSTENVLAELRPDTTAGSTDFFYDDNFAANREHTKELLEGMIREDFGSSPGRPRYGRMSPRTPSSSG